MDSTGCLINLIHYYFNAPKPMIGFDELDGMAMSINEHMEKNTPVAQYLRAEANKAHADEMKSLRD